MPKLSVKQYLRQLGDGFFYTAMRFFGQRGGYLLLYPVVFCYTLFSRQVRQVTSPYLSKRFVNHNCVQRFLHLFRNILAFGRILVDQGWLKTDKTANFDCETVGGDTLVKLINDGKGVVLVTGHVGNWHSALSRLDFLPTKIHALMQYDQHAQANDFSKQEEKNNVIEIIDTDDPMGGMIEATAALQRGEVVTIMGDRFVKGTSSTVDFLGHKTKLPNGAYTLAALVGSPVVIFLAAKTSPKQFQVKIWEVFYPKFETRDRRQQTLDECCRKYALCLEKYLKIYPYQWYNFYNFWKHDNNE